MSKTQFNTRSKFYIVEGISEMLNSNKQETVQIGFGVLDSRGNLFHWVGVDSKGKPTFKIVLEIQSESVMLNIYNMDKLDTGMLSSIKEWGKWGGNTVMDRGEYQINQ